MRYEKHQKNPKDRKSNVTEESHRGCFLRERTFSFSPHFCSLAAVETGNKSAINPYRSMFVEGGKCGESMWYWGLMNWFLTNGRKENNRCSQNGANSGGEMERKERWRRTNEHVIPDHPPKRASQEVCSGTLALCINLQRILVSAPRSLTPTLSSFNTPSSSRAAQQKRSLPLSESGSWRWLPTDTQESKWLWSMGWEGWRQPLTRQSKWLQPVKCIRKGGFMLFFTSSSCPGTWWGNGFTSLWRKPC